MRRAKNYKANNPNNPMKKTILILALAVANLTAKAYPHTNADGAIAGASTNKVNVVTIAGEARKLRALCFTGGELKPGISSKAQAIIAALTDGSLTLASDATDDFKRDTLTITIQALATPTGDVDLTRTHITLLQAGIAAAQ
jgi:D-serine deaminase-like pyridoxal phosphate-dependent protein